MLKVILLSAMLGLSVARPGGLGTYGYGGHRALEGAAYGAGAYGVAALAPSAAVSTSYRADVFGPAVAYSAGAPYPGAATLPYGLNAGYGHVSTVSLATPLLGNLATGGYGRHGYGGYGGHALGHY